MSRGPSVSAVAMICVAALVASTWSAAQSREATTTGQGVVGASLHPTADSASVVLSTAGTAEPAAIRPRATPAYGSGVNPYEPSTPSPFPRAAVVVATLLILGWLIFKLAHG